MSQNILKMTVGLMFRAHLRKFILVKKHTRKLIFHISHFFFSSRKLISRQFLSLKYLNTFFVLQGASNLIATELIF